MTEVNTTNNRSFLRKEVIPGVTMFSLGLLVIAGLIGVIITIVQLTGMIKDGIPASGDSIFGMSQELNSLIQTLIMLIDIPLGLFVASLLSNRSKWAPIGMGGETIFYAFSILLTQNWALFIANGIYTPLIWLYGYFLWNKDEDLLQDENTAAVTGEVKTKKLNFNSLMVVIGTVVGISVLFAFLLPVVLPQFFVGTKSFIQGPEAGESVWNIANYTVIDVTMSDGKIVEMSKWFAWFQIILDAFLAAVAIVATTMAVFRYAETWLLFFISNTFKLLLFGITLIVALPLASPMMFVMAAAYFANALYGMIVWKDSEEVDIFEKEKSKA